MTPQELKNSILQRAMQGRLVAQNFDEDAPSLLGINQKSTKEYGYELPFNWKTGHIESVTDAIPSKQYQILQSQVFNEGKFPVISQSKEYSIGFSNEEGKLFCHKSPVVIFGDHTTEIKLVDFDFIVGADGVKIFSPKEMIITPSFLFFALQLFTYGLSKVGGYSRHYKYIKDNAIPLPPLAEQKRIVARIEEILPLLDRYEAAWNKLEDLNKRFPVDMQKSILQRSIQGKLVKQRPEEGTGEELYQQIQVEKAKLVKEDKIKKQKSLPEISEDEVPFDIPESWKWVRLNSVISLLSGADLASSKFNEKAKGIPYITGASNINAGEIIINRWTEYPNNIARFGDLLLSCKGTVGKTAILHEREAHIARQIMAITNVIVDMRFIRFFIISQLEAFKSKAKSMIPGIERADVLGLAFPLPPLEEQKRIVEKLEESMRLCEKLM